MNISLLTVPYDAGHFNERMGAGPKYILKSGLLKRLKAAGHDVHYEEIKSDVKYATENATSFDLLNKISGSVTTALNNKRFPVALSGNCNTTVGVIAAVREKNTGILWFDAHGDCETPDTTISGFLDGMAISTLMGYCWQNILMRINGYQPLPGKNITLIGARDLSGAEKELIKISGIQHLKAAKIKQNRSEAISELIERLKNKHISLLHIHIDLDVLDPSIAAANTYAVPGGLFKEDIIEIIFRAKQNFILSSATISAYDPSCDKNDKILNAAIEFIEQIIK